MSTGKGSQVTPLNAGHPLAAVIATVPLPNAGDAAGAASAIACGTTVTAGGVAANANGLTFTGIAAVCTAYATYVGTLTALKKSQMGQMRVLITPTSVELPVHSADVTTFAATLAGVLNTGGNSGAIGS
jgi:hypothetical protein